MIRMTRAAVSGLFGYANHEISLRPYEPTIITAPNGAGKTHLLLSIKATLALDAESLHRLPLERVELEFDSGHTVTASKRPTSEGSEVTYHLRRWTVPIEGPLTLQVTEGDDGEGSPKIPPFLEELPDGNWFDARRGRVVSGAYVRSFYRVSSATDKEQARRTNPSLVELLRELHPVLIDTKRLDAQDYLMREPSPPGRGGIRDARTGSGPSAARIVRYIDRIRAEVVSARQESVRATQSSDLSFAARALQAANARVNEKELHSRYDKIVEEYERLARNSLALGDAPLEFPTKTTPTVRRILNVFLDDWEKRLQPLIPLNQKLGTLRDILDTKLGGSGKYTTIDGEGRLGFRARGGRRIGVASLSSGEQHLVALFSLLLFSSRSGSLVLIDEPEISMHAAWKHAFLEDIARVAEVVGFQIVLATHSTAIVNGRWDLEESLPMVLPPEQDEDEGDSEIDADEIYP